MSRASTHWLLGLVLLASLGPTLAFACKPEPQSAWTMRSGNGRFTLSMNGTELALRKGRSKVLWKQDVAYLSQKEVLISSSGRHVATVTQAGSIVIYGQKGKPLGKWNVLDGLTKSEQARLVESPCGPYPVTEATFKGEALEVAVAIKPIRPAQGSWISLPGAALLRIDPQTGRLTRKLFRHMMKPAAVIALWRSSPAGDQRDEALEELSVWSLATNKPGALPELRSFWRELLTAPESQQAERAAAVRGLWRIGTDEEVRSLTALLDTELSALVLEALCARLPQEAEPHASRILENPSSPEALRKLAVSFLINRKGLVAERGVALGLRDPSASVRESVLLELARRPPSASAFDQILPFCQDAEPSIRQRAVTHLLHLVESRGPERKLLLATLQLSDTSGRLEPFPEGWIILGGVADLEGRRLRALQLYAKGVTGLTSAGSAETRSPGSFELLVEGLLQLALEAKKQGKQDELSQRVHHVLSLPNAEGTLVSAPRPNRYARADATASSTGAAGRRPATAVARELTGKPAPVNKRLKAKAPYDPFRVGP
jgi:hypothetical protein